MAHLKVRRSPCLLGTKSKHFKGFSEYHLRDNLSGPLIERILKDSADSWDYHVLRTYSQNSSGNEDG